jgi:hypothetical protein
MANVDKELHNPEVTAGNLIKERTTSKPKRSLRGAAGGTYVGPVLSNAAIDHQALGDATNSSHAVGAAGGGVEDSTGYRESDTYRIGTAEDSTTATARSTGRSMYRADGVFGGSTPGQPAQRSSQRASAKTSGQGLTAEGAAPVFLDKRSNTYGDGGVALGSAGRGTRTTSTGGTVTVTRGGVGQATGQPRLPKPTIQAADPGASLQIQIVDGTGGAVHADLHADDITDGANGYAGCVIYCFDRDTDTDEDEALIAKGDFDTVEEGAVTGLTGLTAGTYAFYAAFKDAAGNIGPWSDRLAVAIT